MADAHDSAPPDQPYGDSSSGDAPAPAGAPRRESAADEPQSPPTLAPTGPNGALTRSTATVVTRSQHAGNPEEIQRIQVDDEDRLAFRVGVNLLTLALIGLGIWLLIRFLRG